MSETLKLVHELRLRGDNSNARAFWAAWAPNGHHIVTAGTHSEVQLWDVSTGRCFDTLRGHGDWVRYAAYSADGNLIATACDDGAVRIWDLTNNSSKPFFFTKPKTDRLSIRGVSISSDNKILACADFLGQVQIYRVLNGDPGEPAASFRAQRHYCLAAEFSGSSDNLLTCGSEGTAEIWPVMAILTGNPEGTAPRPSMVFRGHIGSVHDASYSHDGSQIATAGSDGTTLVWDASRGRQLFCSPPKNIDKLEQIAEWDMDFNKSLWANSAHISPNRTMVASSGNDGRLQIWSLQAHGLLIEHQLESEVRSVRFSPDGSSLVTASSDNIARVWQLE